MTAPQSPEPIPPTPAVPVIAPRRRCGCSDLHRPRLLVLTGGPGAGKTAVLEVVRRQFCEHVVVLPESASILFGGGFPRLSSDVGRRAAQRAIFHVQRELEEMGLNDSNAALVLCDRGTLDGLAYWPGDVTSFLADLHTSKERELARYAKVIHLQTPTDENGYNNHSNPLRTESVKQAHAIDARIGEAWREHAKLVRIPSSQDFVAKTARAIAEIAAELPDCCREVR